MGEILKKIKALEFQKQELKKREAKIFELLCDEIITGEYKKYSFVCDNSEYGFYTTIDVYNDEVVMISENQKPEPINDNCYKTSYFVSC